MVRPMVFVSIQELKLAAKGVIISAEGTGAGIQNDANNTDITLNDVTINANDGPGIRTSVALNMKDGLNNILNVNGKGKLRL